MVYVQLILTPTVLVCETVVVGIVVVLDEIVEDPAAPVGATAVVC